MKTLLITGATGYLGNYLVHAALERGWNPVAIGHSESKVKAFEGLFPNVPLYILDIASDREALMRIMNRHRPDALIHAAAMKYVNICQDNPLRAVDVNVIGTKNLIDVATLVGIPHCLLISTDKSIDASCVYGVTKNLAQTMALHAGWGVFQGVNFLGSTGSVLHIWEEQMRWDKPIRANGGATRYFALPLAIATHLLDGLERKGTWSVPLAYRIPITLLAAAWCQWKGYTKQESVGLLACEKTEEALPPGVLLTTPNLAGVVSLLERWKEEEAILHRR